MQLTSEQIERMVIPSDYVLIKIDKMFDDEVKFTSGFTLYLDPSWQMADHVRVYGTVVKVPQKLTFDLNRKNPTLEWKTTLYVWPGDVVYMDYHSVLMALGKKADKGIEYAHDTWISDEKKNLYILIPYSDLFCKMDSDWNPVPINGYVLIKEVEEHWQSKNIILPGNIKSIKSMKVGQIIVGGTPNLQYDNPRYTDDIDVSPGDFIIFHAYANRRMEYDLHAKMKTTLSAVQMRYIHAKIEDFDAENFYVQFFK